MKKLLFACIGAVLLSAPQVVRADNLIAEYYSLLSVTDAYNSQGQPLNDLCAILRQDRANWHRFGKRDDVDNGDPIFGAPARRAQMQGRCVYDGAYYGYAGDRIRSGSRSFFVHVRVYGNASQITQILISEGAG